VKNERNGKEGLTLYHEDIFTKIKKVFQKLFSNDLSGEGFTKQNAAQSAKMRLSTDKQNSVFTLQKRYENNEIAESELSDIEKLKLMQLYDEQNRELESEIIVRKEELSKKKEQLDNYCKKIIELTKKQKQCIETNKTTA